MNETTIIAAQLLLSCHFLPYRQGVPIGGNRERTGRCDAARGGVQ